MLRQLTSLATVLSLSVALAACSDDPPAAPKPSTAPSSTATPPPTVLTFGAYGNDEELAAFQEVVDGFNSASQTRRVRLRTWATHKEALADVLAGDAPDVFMTSRRDLGRLTEEDAVQPVGLLLDERGVDFGDRFSRDAVESFSLDDDLQCMAYSISPMVIYYNDELIDFEKMSRRGLDVPPVDAKGVRSPRWSLAEFTAAAEFAARKRKVDGVWIEPTLRGLAPFIYSGGGHVFDDDNEPTSLALADESTRDSLERTLAVLRDPTLTPSSRRLEEFSALQLFERGELGMIAGFRDLVPRLRQVPRLSFDTISMPVLDSPSTVGDIEGLCISADTQHVNDAADFMAYAVSDAAIGTVTRTGYIVPANTEVAGSEVFLGPGRQPVHASVFNSAIRGMVIPPLLADTSTLEATVGPMLDDLLNSPGVLDLEQATEAIDEASRPVLSPTEAPTESPSESTSESTSGSVED